jgi:hypothetical protein
MQLLVYDRKKVIHQEDVDLNDSTSIRNLYLKFYASNYDVEIFLQKRESGEFTAFSGAGNVTPPQYNPRSNVFVLDK